MSFRRPWPGGPSAACRAALIGAGALVLSTPTATRAANVFVLAETAQVIVQGVVRDVTSYKDGKFQVFNILPERVLKGAVTVGTALPFVQEIVFPSDRPYFETGARTLVFAVPLPPYSSYREALPPLTYWRWAEDKKTAAEIAAFRDPALTDPIAAYLASRDDAAATARLMASLLASPAPRLRSDALGLLEARPALAHSIDREALAPFEAALQKDEPPLADQALAIVRLGTLGAPGLTPIAEQLAAKPGPLRAPALNALVSLDRLPAESVLLARSRSSDPALRIAAVRGLVHRPTQAALDRVAEMLKRDPSNEVRLGALEALGGSDAARAVPMLAVALRDSDKGRIDGAAEALGRIASPAAITALGEALAHGSYEAQVASAFALMNTRKPEAIAVLNTQMESASDPRVRKVIEIALGRMPDEHE